MSDSDGSINWEDATEDIQHAMDGVNVLDGLDDLMDGEDGDYMPPASDDDEYYDDFDEDDDDEGEYIEFTNAAGDTYIVAAGSGDGGEGEGEDQDEDGDRESAEEDDDDEDDGPFGTFGINPQQATILQLAALMESANGGGRSAYSLLERLVLNARGLSLNPRERTARERAAERKREQWWDPQIEPNPEGLALLTSGEFGAVGPWAPGPATATPTATRAGPAAATGCMGSTGPSRRRPSEVFSARQRYAGIPGRRFMTSRYQITSHVKNPPIPNTPGTVVAAYPSVPYVGQFCGENDSIFYSATRGFKLYLYNMAGTTSSRPTATRGAAYASADVPADAEYTNHFDDNDDDDDESDDDRWFGGWRPRHGLRGIGRGDGLGDSSLPLIKAEQGEVGQWTVTDAHADRTGRRMIYSSITPYVYMMNTADDGAPHHELDFTNRQRYQGFGIWSIRFSADGNEVVAGASTGRIMVYDIQADRRTLHVTGHRDDVNAVCFADESSTNILVSGSDDGFVKIWDRRSLASNTPAGVLPGATQGITYTAPKGDGRYIVVNSKDQAARLYDLRKMRSWSEFEGERDAVARWGYGHFDYRNMTYPVPQRLAHPRDCSVMTFRGHRVLRTLIRCHFSPLESTGQSYIYSGSADGRIHIWSLDGRVVHVLDRSEARPLHPGGNAASGGPGYTDPSGEERTRAQRLGASIHSQATRYTVRDVAWHSRTPTLMSTCWEMEGQYRNDTGSVAMHEWKGLGKGGLESLEDWTAKKAQEEQSRPTSW